MYSTDELQTIANGSTEEFTAREISMAVALLQLRENPRDAHHTMAELYEQRMLWHAYATYLHDYLFPDGATQSWHHHDGQPCFGKTEPGERWFVVTMNLPNGKQVTQHYPEKDWNLFDAAEVEVAPVWDGHTPAEGNQRLRDYLTLGH